MLKSKHRRWPKSKLRRWLKSKQRWMLKFKERRMLKSSILLCLDCAFLFAWISASIFALACFLNIKQIIISLICNPLLTEGEKWGEKKNAWMCKKIKWFGLRCHLIIVKKKDKRLRFNNKILKLSKGLNSSQADKCIFLFFFLLFYSWYATTKKNGKKM